MKKGLFVVCLVYLNLIGVGQDKPAYRLYREDGKKVTWKSLLKATEGADVVLFGELHNNAIAHWLELELTKDLYSMAKRRGQKLVLGAEMLESDNQSALNQYLSGTIKQKGLDTLARLWPNYKTDYAPLVNFARDSSVPFIATNIPRKYATLVFKRDFAVLDSLSASEKEWLAPLPILYDSSLACYADMRAMMGDHGGSTLPKAQAIKDATMAWFIHRQLATGTRLLHFNGSYHSDRYLGIGWYLRKYHPGVKVVTISVVTRTDPEKRNFEAATADFVIQVDEDMTETY